MESLIAIIALAIVSVPVLLVVVLVQLASLRARVRVLELQLPQPGAQPAPAPAVAVPTPAAAGIAGTAATPQAAAAPAVGTAPPPRPAATPASTAGGPSPGARQSSRPSLLEVPVRLLRNWFSQGNVPVKVGMLVLFLGVASLLKYASDQGWMQLPVELRLAGIAIAAIAGLALGWRQRGKRRTFALSLQGGSIGILLMTVFAAYRMFDLLPGVAAFAFAVLVVAGTAVMAVRQDALALAVLAVLAGFLAPILTSTGAGSHVALFGYYAVLNLGILAIALLRPWRILNLLGFVFTFVVGVAWGVLAYRPEQLASTLPFLALFFLLYLAIPWLYARRRRAGRRDLVDGCLVFGNPLVSFALLAGLLEGARIELAFTALGLALLYVGLAWALRARGQLAGLMESWAILGVGFATLAVPLALSARATASVFALEGAALVWLGLRQARRLPLWSGIALQSIAGLALWIGHTARADEAMLANPGFVGALVVAIAGMASAWSCRSAARARLALYFYLWGLGWWLLAGAVEIDRFAAPSGHATAWLAWLVSGLGLVALAMRRSTFAPLGWTAVGLLAGVVFATLGQVGAIDHPFQGRAALAWLAHAGLGLAALAAMRAREPHARLIAWALGLWLLGWTMAVAFALAHSAGWMAPGGGWRPAAFALPWLVVLAGVLLAPRWTGFPFGDRIDAWQRPVSLAFAIAALGLWAALVAQPGGSQPLPFVPLLNPLELAASGLVVLLARWLWTAAAPAALHRQRNGLVAVLVFTSLSAMTLRAVHHHAGIDWSGSMLDTALAQSSLTLLWSVLGVAAWIIGSRRGQHAVWLVGAIAMGVVLLKLVVVDRQHLGNLAGIASFIGYGLLCTVVGYFAPAPPRSTAHAPPATGDVA